MRITVKTGDVLKKLEAKKATIDSRRKVILDELKKANAHTHKYLAKAYTEVIAELQAELKAVQAGKPIPDAKSIVKLDSGSTRRGTKNYHAMIQVFTTQKIEDLYPNKWGRRYEKDRLNAQLRRLEEMLSAVKMSSSDTMEVDSDRGEYFELMQF